MAGPAASLPVPRLQLLYTAIDRMLDHVINTALTDSSTPQKTQHQQRLQHWKQQVMVISAITTLQPGSAAPRFTAAVRPPLSSPPRLRRPVLCYQLEVEAIIDERRLLDLLSQVEQLSLRTSANGDDAQPMSAEPSPSHPPLQLQVTAGQSNSRSPPMFALRLHSPLVSLSAPADELRDEIAALHQRQSKSLQDTADEVPCCCLSSTQPSPPDADAACVITDHSLPVSRVCGCRCCC